MRELALTAQGIAGSPGGPLGLPTVLLVEDDRELSRLVSGLLGGAGYHPVTIADHDDIAAAVDRWRPRCVILDGELVPQGQERSWDDAIAIRRAHPDLPVLMFTADAAALAEAIDGTSGRSRAAGFAGVVEKPFVVDEFLATVRDVVEGPQVASAATAATGDDRILAITLFPEAGASQAEDAAQVALLSTVVHELRTPLTSISGQIQLAQRNILLDPEVQRIALGRALAQVARMDRLISELLDRSRIAAGALTLEIGIFDLSAVVAEVVSHHEVGETPRISFEPTKAQVRVRGDAVRVAQIVGNLMTNALKYAPAGSQVSVALGVVGSEALILVEDRGVGIPAD
ncbi:MAG: histidine kinase dimerization/phospho-acceptor domain-containing protein, partial [Candidatus Limnocylindria bacterium]